MRGDNDGQGAPAHRNLAPLSPQELRDIRGEHSRAGREFKQ
jgi:hypothetical protein